MDKITDVNKYLTINQKLLIEVKLGEYAGIYDSRIEDMDKEFVYISMPSERGVVSPLKPNTKLHMSYVMKRGRLSFKSVVIDRMMKPLPMLKVTKPEVLFHEELRAFFRVDTRVPAKIMVDIEEDGIIKQKMYEARIMDMSGGGCRVSSEKKLEKGQSFELFFLDDEINVESVKLTAKRVVKVEDRYEAGTEFVDIQQGIRDRIIKYVFKRQVELRKLMG